MDMNVIVNYKMSQPAADLLAAAGFTPHMTGVQNAVKHDGWKALSSLPEEVRRSAPFMLGSAANIDRALLALLPGLKWFHSVLSGISGSVPFDWSLVEGRGIAITTSKIHEHPVSEFALAHLLALAKSVPAFLDRQRAGRYDRTPPIAMLRDQTALVVGTGNIGREIGRKLAVGFGMTVLGVNRDGRPVEHFARCGTSADIDAMLADADFVILACAATDDTRGMMRLDRFRRMKRTACLVNIARGALVVEADLVQALREGLIAGAGLDVFEQEPVPSGSPLWTAPNLLMTPHMAYYFPHSDMRVAQAFLDEYHYYVAGKIAESPNYANIRRY